MSGVCDRLSHLYGQPLAGLGRALYLGSMITLLANPARFRRFGQRVVPSLSVVTGLMLAGRVGASVAAEIGTMKVSEQIDALRVMNVHPIDYLVTPRILAMFIAMPLLIAESAAFGIAASVVVGKSGNKVMRRLELTANAFRRPSLTSGTAAAAGEKNQSSRPAMTSINPSDVPLNGTCVAVTPAARSLSTVSTASRCGDFLADDWCSTA